MTRTLKMIKKKLWDDVVVVFEAAEIDLKNNKTQISWIESRGQSKKN